MKKTKAVASLMPHSNGLLKPSKAGVVNSHDSHRPVLSRCHDTSSSLCGVKTPITCRPRSQMGRICLISAATPAALVVVILPLILDEVLCHAAQDCATDGSQEAVVGLLAEHVSTKATADGAEETTIGLRHSRRIGVVVGGVRVTGLFGELVLTDIRILVAGLASLAQLLLVGLVLGVGIVAATGLLLLAVVAWRALRVRGVVGAVLLAYSAVLEAAVLRGPERILPTGRGEALVLGRILLRVALLRVLLVVVLVVTLLRRVALLLAVALLRVLGLLAVATLAGVGIVRAGHGAERCGDGDEVDEDDEAVVE